MLLSFLVETCDSHHTYSHVKQCLLHVVLACEKPKLRPREPLAQEREHDQL